MRELTVVGSADAGRILDGAVLSDAFISRHYASGDSHFATMLSGKGHMDWLYSIKSALISLHIRVSDRYPYVFPVVKRGKFYEYCFLRSRSNPHLTEMRDRWYPNGKKEVPENFTFTGLSLASAFMGDGNSSIDSRRLVGASPVHVRLCTQGYSPRSIEIIEHALHRLGIVTGREKYSSGTGLAVLQGSVNYFMDIVEPYIVPSYMYKIKRRCENA